jgi:hypothetical protein
MYGNRRLEEYLGTGILGSTWEQGGWGSIREQGLWGVLGNRKLEGVFGKRGLGENWRTGGWGDFRGTGSWGRVSGNRAYMTVCIVTNVAMCMVACEAE